MIPLTFTVALCLLAWRQLELQQAAIAAHLRQERERALFRGWTAEASAFVAGLSGPERAGILIALYLEEPTP